MCAVSLEQCQSLVNSCSISGKGVAIGLIPSPILANVYLKEFDAKLYAWLKKRGYPNVIYTRYADDITISFKESEEVTAEEIKMIIARVRELLKDFYLELNDRKTRMINLNVSNHVRITGLNLTRDSNNYRKLTVGRKRKDELFYNAMDEYKKQGEKDFAQKIKGMQSFILSVEGGEYEDSYSINMKNAIKQLGFNSLKELIDSL